MVTVDGERLRVSAEQEPELFWAMRGAGANFGVATSFEVAAHPVRRTVLGGDLVPAGDKGLDALRRLRELALTCSTDLYFFALYGLAEPLPGIPVELHRRLVLTAFAAHPGEPDAAAEELRELRTDAQPDADLIRQAGYVDLHLDQDEIYPEIRQYWAAEHVPLSDAVIDVIHDVALAIEDHSVIDLYPWSGAMDDRAPRRRRLRLPRHRLGRRDARAVDRPRPRRRPARLGRADLRRPARDRRGRHRRLPEHGQPPSARRGRASTSASARWARLEAPKRRFDPANRLHRNANVPPPAA